MQTLSFLSILNAILLNVFLNCPTIIISDFNINMLSTTIQLKSLQDIWKNIISILHLPKLHLFVTHKLTVYGQMHHKNNVILNQHMFIGHIVNLHILHSNYQIMFLILYCLEFSNFFHDVHLFQHARPAC
jgi:subtilase family serine protease